MNIKTLNRKCIIAGLSCLLVVSSQAAVVVTLSASAPTVDIISSNVITTGTPGNITAYEREQGTNLKQSIGQGFSTAGLSGNYSMTAAIFFLSSFTNVVQGKGFEIGLYEVASASSSPDASNSVLLSAQTGTLPSTLLANSFITFDLDVPVVLSPNRFYVVMYSFTEPTGVTEANTVSFTTIGSGSTSPASAPNTSGGYRWQKNDAGNNGSVRNGFVFFVEATAIPEPSTYALLGLSALALVILRKRRHA